MISNDVQTKQAIPGRVYILFHKEERKVTIPMQKIPQHCDSNTTS